MRRIVAIILILFGVVVSVCTAYLFCELESQREQQRTIAVLLNSSEYAGLHERLRALPLASIETVEEAEWISLGNDRRAVSLRQHVKLPGIAGWVGGARPLLPESSKIQVWILNESVELRSGWQMIKKLWFYPYIAINVRKSVMITQTRADGEKELVMESDVWINPAVATTNIDEGD